MKILVFMYGCSLALSIWFFLVRSRGKISDRLAVFLQIVAGYTMLLGLFSTAGVLDSLVGLERDLTSSNPLKFLRGNLVAFAALFSAVAVGLDPSTGASAARFLTTVPVLLGLLVLLAVYAVFHFLVVVPIAYLGYVITGIPIDAILRAQPSADVTVTFGVSELRIKTLVEQNELPLRNFAVALPAFVLSLVLKMGPFLRSMRKHRPEPAAQ